MNAYDRGDLVRLSASFDVDDVATNPTALTFKLLRPDGTTQAYVAGTDAQLVHDSTGNYHVDWSAAQEGVHYYRFEGTGAAQAASEQSFVIRHSRFS